MNLDYVPLLQVQRDLYDIPRSRGRFKHYLRTIFDQDELGMRLPLLAMNPMGKEHATALLDGLLALEGDAIGAQAAAEASARLADVPVDFKIALVVVDDLKGGWTNRYANEFDYRFGGKWGPSSSGTQPKLPRWLKHFWLFGVLWTSEGPSEQAAREAILMAAYRVGYVHRHGPARTLRDMLAQEGHVMAQAGCSGPVLDAEDIDYTREVLIPYLDADDKRTCIECLFGDAAGRTLGFTPRDLSPWAGLALALHDAWPKVGADRAHVAIASDSRETDPGRAPAWIRRAASGGYCRVRQPMLFHVARRP
jgi:hypothetical protein